ncbi:hypothetical protein [Metabacillus sp. 22489]
MSFKLRKEKYKLRKKNKNANRVFLPICLEILLFTQRRLFCCHLGYYGTE